MEVDIYAVGSPYLCKDNVLIIEEHGYGNIILEIRGSGINKPGKEILDRYRYEIPSKECRPLLRKDLKELNIRLKKIDYILLDQRDEYTIYEVTYRDLKAYIVENWNGYSAELKFEVFKEKDDAVSWVFSK